MGGRSSCAWPIRALSLGLALTLPAQAMAAEPRTAQADPIVVSGFDLGFDPTDVRVPEPGRYEFVLTNDGAIQHDLTFTSGETSGLIESGEQSAPVAVEIPAEGVDFFCSLPGHREAGMAGRVSVLGAPSASADPGGSPSLPPPDPAAPAYVPVDATAPSPLDGDSHDIEMVIVETPLTVAPGYVVLASTIGGRVPAPVIRVRVGDTLRVRLVNPAANTASHGLSFGGSGLAPNAQPPVPPGGEATYEWQATHAGVWLYRGTGPSELAAVASGLFGMLIVEPEGGLPPVDRELALVQSEWYFEGQGAAPSLARAAAVPSSPDWIVFNGVAGQYADTPIPVGPDQRVRIFLLDAGPTLDASFHVSDLVFESVIREGVQLVAGNPGGWGSGTLDLAPGQGAIVELTMGGDGLYPFGSGALSLFGRGAGGLLQSGDGDPAN